MGVPVPGSKVALRKESVDRNVVKPISYLGRFRSLSARRAWIEMLLAVFVIDNVYVALRKESVDRNDVIRPAIDVFLASLSARRAWIEIANNTVAFRCHCPSRSPQGERG